MYPLGWGAGWAVTRKYGVGVSLTLWDTHGTPRGNSIQLKPIDYNLQSYTIQKLIYSAVGESVSFIGTATDSDGTIATTQWLVDGVEVATGLSATLSLPDGSTVVTFKELTAN